MFLGFSELLELFSVIMSVVVSGVVAATPNPAGGVSVRVS